MARQTVFMLPEKHNLSTGPSPHLRELEIHQFPEVLFSERTERYFD